jgi:hypothetical protein
MVSSSSSSSSSSWCSCWKDVREFIESSKVSDSRDCF